MVTRGSIDFGDILGKLEYLEVKCERCPRAGRYAVATLLAQHGRHGRLMDFTDKLSADCPNRTRSVDDRRRCRVICPDLPKVV